MKKIINLTESELSSLINKIVNEVNAQAGDSSVRVLERLMNKVLPKKYPWWKKIEIDLVRGSTYRATLYGTLLVDIDWAAEQYEEFHNKNFYPENFEDEDDQLGLGDIISVTDPITDDMLTIMKTIYTDNQWWDISFVGLILKFYKGNESQFI